MNPRLVAVVRDALGVTAVAAVVALAANAVSPRGLSLTRDYFPAAHGVAARPVAPVPTSAAAEAKPGTAPATPAAAVRSARGFPLASRDEVLALFRDPRRQDGRVLFVDARDPAHYRAGHIPGAHAFDHYHPEEHLADVLGAAAIAERIVVYCNGGDCEDSELATLDLIQAGIPADKFVIYGGGITDWKAHALPLTTESTGGAQP